MNIKKLILFIAVSFTIILTVILFNGITNYMTNYPTDSKFIEVRKFETIQENYVEISTEELKEYTILERIIIGEGCTNADDNNWRCDVSDEEFNKLLNLYNKKPNPNSLFKIKENYYRLGFGTP